MYGGQRFLCSVTFSLQISGSFRHGSILERRRCKGHSITLRDVFAHYFNPQAPHHSRASWMKFWRRHKHELNRTDGDDPLPQPPEKKMRYSRSDDILLAKYFFTKPEGTSDKIFQAFGRQVCTAFIPCHVQSVSAIITASSSPMERMARASPDTQSKN